LDPSKYYQTNKGRLLAFGTILIVLGIVLFFAKGVQDALVLPVFGVVLLIAGVVHKPRQKKVELKGNTEN
jgi:uncharacterized membrane protein HdeD (DUF308 family)